MHRQNNTKGGRRKSYDNVVYGRQPVLELITTSKPVDKILMQQGAHGDVISEIRKTAKEKGIPVKVVPEEKLKSITNANHQGVIAFTAAVAFQKLEDILPFVIEKGETPLILILDSITDVRNFGAISRTAYASGVHAIVIPFMDTAPLNSEAIKASAGALQNIPVCRAKNLQAVMDYLELNGITIIGTDAQSTTSIYQVDLTVPLAFILGSEDTGISYVLQKRFIYSASVPMARPFDSYNVSVAAGMILYETMRQRMLH
ncbi:MAG: 23S rRNA (guanosine(2251)-2'-O)-methyltransferase RlmB [Chitinophagales bacterium]